MSAVIDYLKLLGFLVIRILLDLILLILSPFLFVWERISSGKKKTYKSIFITGGNSGIGEGLALAFAAPGVHLTLTARNAEKLTEVAEKAKKKGAEVRVESVDVREKKKMEELIRKVDGERAIDLIIANAGVAAETLGTHKIDEYAYDLLDINVTGVLNTIHPIIPLFRKRGSGQIAIMSSIASNFPLPSAVPYSASKAAVRYYGEALRPILATEKIGVSVVSPGFVKSNIVSKLSEKNKSPPAFMLETDAACDIIKDGLERNVPVITFPFPLLIMTQYIED